MNGMYELLICGDSVNFLYENITIIKTDGVLNASKSVAIEMNIKKLSMCSYYQECAGENQNTVYSYT